MSSPELILIDTCIWVPFFNRTQSREKQIVDALLPDAPPGRLFSFLHNLPVESCVLCVGHEPHLGMVASVMLAGKPSTAFPFKKAGACLIELPIPVKPGRGVLRWWLPPGQLRDMGEG